ITYSGSINRAYTNFQTTGCSSLSGVGRCEDNALAGEMFTISPHNSTGELQTINGTSYIAVISIDYKDGGAGTLNVCFNANEPEAADNECAGATGLGSGTQSFYNGGNCSYTGSYTDATTSDPAPADVCAGSLENTQWIEFRPAVGATSFEIQGTGIHCTGGGCGYQFGMFSGSCGSLTPEGALGRGGSCGGNGDCGGTNPSGGIASVSWSNVSISSFTATFTPNAPATSFTGSEVFYMVMDGNANSDCHFDLTGVNITPLSSEQGTLKGSRKGNKNVLTWSALGKPEQVDFTLQRSTDGINWLSMFSTPVKNTIDVVNYSYTDEMYVHNKTNYYRVVGDFSGQMKVITKTVALTENSDKTVSKLIAYDVFGRQINPGENPSGLIIYVTEYEDGTVETRKEYRSNVE
ncbi:MAG: hypothetical protein ACLGGV_06215, partial [Bacteroidia bacterium]